MDPSQRKPMTAIDKKFQEYFQALDRTGGEDCCFICRRTPADVKRFFGFDEDGVPLEQGRFGLEDIVLDQLDIMSYRGLRPVCAVCQLNHDGLTALGEHETVRRVMDEMEHRREHLWPER